MTRIKGLRAGYGSLDILNGVDLEVAAGRVRHADGAERRRQVDAAEVALRHDHDQGRSIEWQGKNIAGYKSRAILAKASLSCRRAAAIFRLMTIDENLQMAAYTLQGRRGEVRARLRLRFVSDPAARRNSWRATCPAASSNCWRWRWPSCAARRSCWWTNPRSVSRRGHRLVFNELMRMQSGGQTILLVEQNTRRRWRRRARGHPAPRQGDLGQPVQRTQQCRTRRTVHDRPPRIRHRHRLSTRHSNRTLRS